MKEYTNVGCLVSIALGVAGWFYRPLLAVAAICLIITVSVSILATVRRARAGLSPVRPGERAETREAGELSTEQFATMLVGHVLMLVGAGWLLVFSLHRL